MNASYKDIFDEKYNEVINYIEHVNKILIKKLFYLQY